MRQAMILAAVLVVLGAVGAARAADVLQPVLSVSIDDPQLWGQPPRGAVVVSAGQTLTGTITLVPGAKVLGLTVRWRDSYGRVGASRTIAPAALGAPEVKYALPLDNPVATRGWVEVIAQPEIQRAVREPQLARAAFVVHSAPKAWDDHYLFVWAHYPAGFGDILRSIGIPGQDTYRFNADMVDAVQTNDLFTYVDNIYWPIFSGYLKNSGVYSALLKAWAANPRDEGIWSRSPSLSEPAALEGFRDAMDKAARANRDGRLMFYNMVDEMGLGLMSSPNNFDWSRPSRVAFGQWLRVKYRTLAALNEQWATNFASWNDVITFHPSFEAMFDRLYGRVLLARQFKTVAAMNEAFGGADAVPSFEAAAAVYSALRTSEPLDDKNIAAHYPRPADDRRGRKELRLLNAQCATAFKGDTQVAGFYNKFDAWTFTVKANDDYAGWNLSPWCDFRQFMDEQVAETFGAMRRIGRQCDPGGRFGLTGTHQPGATTGHNYELLANQVDVVVPYDVGSAARILHGLRPEMIVLRPVWPRQRPTAYVWSRLLDGDNGTIYWDNDEKGINFIDRKTGEPTELAKTLAPAHKLITRGVGKQVLAGRQDDSGIAVYYSQPSVRVGWWRDRLSIGRKWTSIGTGDAVGRDKYVHVRHSWIDLIENLGLGYRFISGEQVAAGELEGRRPKVLVLPEILALGDAEIAEVAKFVRGGGVVIADRLVGVTDDCGKARPAGVLDWLLKLEGVHVLGVNVQNYDEQWRTGDKQAAEVRAKVEAILKTAGVTAPAAIVDREMKQPAINLVSHVWHMDGGVRLLGLSTNWSEFGFDDKERIELGPQHITLRLAKPVHAYDIKAGKSLGRKEQVDLDLADDYSAVLALSDEPLPPLKASVTRDGRTVRVVLENPAGEVRRAVRVDVLDPAGKELLYYSTNVLLSEVARGRGEHKFALALNDPPGDYKVVVRDILTGQRETMAVEVEKAE